MKLSLNSATQKINPNLMALLLSSFEDDLLQPAVEKVLSYHNPQKNREILKLPGTLLKSDPMKLLEILKSSPLFGSSPFLILEKVTESHLEPLKVLLQSLTAEDFFILTTGYLKSSSLLRTFFESSSILAYVPIYSPTPSEIQIEIKSLFTTFKHTPSMDLLEHLSHRYLEASHLIVSELTPFCLFFENPSPLSLDDYRKFATQVSFDELYYLESFFLQTKEILDQNISSFSMISFLRLLNFHMIRLIEMRGKGESGPFRFSNLSMAQRNLYEKALKIWSTSLLLHGLQEIRRLEIEVKNSTLQEPKDMFHCLFQIYA